MCLKLVVDLVIYELNKVQSTTGSQGYFDKITTLVYNNINYIENREDESLLQLKRCDIINN